MPLLWLYCHHGEKATTAANSFSGLRSQLLAQEGLKLKEWVLVLDRLLGF
jgi:hypothetical protein